MCLFNPSKSGPNCGNYYTDSEKIVLNISSASVLSDFSDLVPSSMPCTLREGEAEPRQKHMRRNQNRVGVIIQGTRRFDTTNKEVSSLAENNQQSQGVDV